ncbi:carbohydrate ABC transporter permease [Enterococcus hirae]|uniref:carbohydrate ABC transporter permease n=1 Tax=Enterococcus hirae TaxID=1354 RepID=UPI001378DC9B|nr:carbohydrate ABC transporter permease [Enterococcus hirae]MCK6145161.1 carbohydrate ABC transporter permease [Enterococcus hirae]MCK6172880.1 carbohydrate ABC transporter permease [Enterococcus hirae]NBA16672.1 ABC transporter permease subunit [Enterococcus hirae]NBA17328.1 ABC transporter permease subunit [Enterococcus hirae]
MEMSKQHRNTRILRFLTIVLVGLIALSVFVPVVWVFLASLKDKSEFYSNPWTLPKGLNSQNFIDAFQEANMGNYFLNSVFVTILALGINLVISLPAAYVISRFKFKAQKFLQTFFMAGLFINVNYIVVPIFLMLVNGDRALIEWLPNGFFIDNLFILALTYASTTVPFTIYLLQGYFKTISATYEEAAMIDGATSFQIMVKIFIPMAKPSVITVILFNFLSYWNDYIISLTLIPGEKRTLQVGLLNLMTAQKAAANYGRLYAGMVIVMIPALILYAFIQKQMLEGMAQGGSKE